MVTDELKAFSKSCYEEPVRYGALDQFSCLQG